MRVLYLFNRVRHGNIEDIAEGVDHDGHYYGMLRLARRGIQAETKEIEDYLPVRLCRFLRRRILNVYFVHLPIFFKMLRYDAVFTSTAFGSQLVHAVYPFKKPKWVMLDFSVLGLLGERKTLRQKIFGFIVNRAAGFIAIGEKEARDLEARFPSKKVRFQRMGVDTSFFSPKQGVESKRPRILAVGLDFGRDYDTFFKAIAGMDVDIVMAARPEKMKRFGPLPENVRVERFSPKEMVNQYAAASLVVIPLDISSGLNDAMGCSTLVEAMAMGKAVVATRTPTLESYIRDGENGAFVPPKDAAALREAIGKLVGNPALREKLGDAARKFAVEHCDADMFAAGLADFFKSL